MVASSPSQWAGWHKGGRLNLYSAFWRSHAHCAECPSTSSLCICICICICICSVQSVRLGGELRWQAMYVPPPPEFETQHTESHSWAQKWADPTPQLPLQLSPPQASAALLLAFLMQKSFPWDTLGRGENSELQVFAIHAFCMLMLLSIFDIGDIPFIGCCIAVGLGWYQVATRGEALYSTKHKSLYSTTEYSNTKNKSWYSTTEYSSTTGCNRVRV